MKKLLIKLLIGYVATTLLGLCLFVLEWMDLINRASGFGPSGYGWLMAFTLPEAWAFKGLADAIDSADILLFFMAIKAGVSYGTGSLILFLWNGIEKTFLND